MADRYHQEPRAPVLPVDELTIKDIRAVIPPHCFERSYLKSFGYLAVNLALVAAMSFVPAHIRQLGDLSWFAWPIYWYVQGAFMTGLWVIGHECGHGGFSDSTTVNDVVGIVLHTFLGVPYFAWKHSHAMHHKNCSSMENDEVFVPPVKSKKEIEKIAANIDVDFPLAFTMPVRILQIIIFVTIGWFPGYLIFNATAPAKYSWYANHYNPWGSMFPKSKRLGVMIGDLLMIPSAWALYKYVSACGWLVVFQDFLIPLMIVNFWLVTITQLQHTSLDIPHYTESEWTWIRGALATIDRDFGWFLNTCLHHIHDSHVVHHLFSDMPFYGAIEATPYVAKRLGKYYMRDDTFVLKGLWDVFNHCIFVPDQEGIVWYENEHTLVNKNIWREQATVKFNPHMKQKTQ